MKGVCDAAFYRTRQKQVLYGIREARKRQLILDRRVLPWAAHHDVADILTVLYHIAKTRNPDCAGIVCRIYYCTDCSVSSSKQVTRWE